MRDRKMTTLLTITSPTSLFLLPGWNQTSCQTTEDDSLATEFIAAAKCWKTLEDDEGNQCSSLAKRDNHSPRECLLPTGYVQ